MAYTDIQKIGHKIDEQDYCDLVNEVYDILKTIDYKINKETIRSYIEQQGAENLDAQTIVFYIRKYNITD